MSTTTNITNWHLLKADDTDAKMTRRQPTPEECASVGRAYRPEETYT